MTVTATDLFDYSPASAAAAAEWIVEIPMPYLPGGKPAGWLGANDDHPAGKNARWWYAKRLKIANAWRAAAIQALQRAGVPVGLTCQIEVRIGFRFPTARSNRRDLPNLEPTLKPVIDALNPTKVQNQKGRMIPIPGAGIVADDNQRYVLRGPEVLIGEPLGKDHQHKGMVILYLRRIGQQ